MAAMKLTSIHLKQFRLATAVLNSRCEEAEASLLDALVSEQDVRLHKGDKASFLATLSGPPDEEEHFSFGTLHTWWGSNQYKLRDMYMVAFNDGLVAWARHP